jgi:chorismate mutase/GNAT superfamily N-acetyltransferase
VPAEDPADLVVRPGVPEDLDAVAAMFTEARAAAVPAMPEPVHTAEEDRAWLAQQLAGDREAWVAEQDGHVVGVLLLEGDLLHSVYVRASKTGQGIGSVLLDLAKSLRPHGLELWVFESNARAQQLYARQGFEVVERTDGAANDEKAPDLRMVWPDPLTRLRRRIDDIDDQLARLLDERAGLTAQAQRHKDTSGRRRRDEQREAEIVERMAAAAPNLGRQGMAQIMHAVISASLDAAERGE